MCTLQHGVLDGVTRNLPGKVLVADSNRRELCSVLIDDVNIDVIEVEIILVYAMIHDVDESR